MNALAHATSFAPLADNDDTALPHLERVQAMGEKNRVLAEVNAAIIARFSDVADELIPYVGKVVDEYSTLTDFKTFEVSVSHGFTAEEIAHYETRAALNNAPLLLDPTAERHSDAADARFIKNGLDLVSHKSSIIKGPQGILVVVKGAHVFSPEEDVARAMQRIEFLKAVQRILSERGAGQDASVLNGAIGQMSASTQQMGAALNTVQNLLKAGQNDATKIDRPALATAFTALQTTVDKLATTASPALAQAVQAIKHQMGELQKSPVFAPQAAVPVAVATNMASVIPAISANTVNTAPTVSTPTVEKVTLSQMNPREQQAAIAAAFVAPILQEQPAQSLVQPAVQNIAHSAPISQIESVLAQAQIQSTVVSNSTAQSFVASTAHVENMVAPVSQGLQNSSQQQIVPPVVQQVTVQTVVTNETASPPPVQQTIQPISQQPVTVQPTQPIEAASTRSVEAVIVTPVIPVQQVEQPLPLQQSVVQQPIAAQPVIPENVQQPVAVQPVGHLPIPPAMPIAEQQPVIIAMPVQLGVVTPVADANPVVSPIVTSHEIQQQPAVTPTIIATPVAPPMEQPIVQPIANPVIVTPSLVQDTTPPVQPNPIHTPLQPVAPPIEVKLPADNIIPFKPDIQGGERPIEYQPEYKYVAPVFEKEEREFPRQRGQMSSYDELKSLRSDTSNVMEWKPVETKAYASPGVDNLWGTTTVNRLSEADTKKVKAEAEKSMGACGRPHCGGNCSTCPAVVGAAQKAQEESKTNYNVARISTTPRPSL